MEVTRPLRMGHPRGSAEPLPWVSKQLPRDGTPIVAASDYVAAVADLIRPWIADPYLTLAPMGSGAATRARTCRRFFEVDRHSIAVAALAALGDGRVREARAGTASTRTLHRPGRAEG
jgi:pyruvate dehydrogenase E1 component